MHINVVHQRCQRATSEIVFKQRVTLSPERIIMGNVKQFTLCGTFRKHVLQTHLQRLRSIFQFFDKKFTVTYYTRTRITFIYIYIHTSFYINPRVVRYSFVAS